MPYFNADGYLPAGIHDMTLQQIETELVLPFSTSITRSLIFEGYRRHHRELEATGISIDQFVDGSFVTNKNNPGDVDLVCFYLANDVEALSDTKKGVLHALLGGRATRATRFCDAYSCSMVPESDPLFARTRARRKYWLGEFGFDRNDKAKGIVRTVINGGISL